jgi:hypothetical protein
MLSWEKELQGGRRRQLRLLGNRLSSPRNRQPRDPDWKMMKATKTPTTPVSASATVGSGAVRPAFSSTPLPVLSSTATAPTKPSIAPRLSHTSSPPPPPPLAPCSHLTLRALGLAFLLLAARSSGLTGWKRWRFQRKETQGGSLN